MKYNSRVPAFKTNEKERTVHQKNLVFSWVMKLGRESDDWTVAGGLFHDAGHNV